MGANQRSLWIPTGLFGIGWKNQRLCIQQGLRFLSSIFYQSPFYFRSAPKTPKCWFVDSLFWLLGICLSEYISVVLSFSLPCYTWPEALLSWLYIYIHVPVRASYRSRDATSLDRRCDRGKMSTPYASPPRTTYRSRPICKAVGIQ